MSTLPDVREIRWTEDAEDHIAAHTVTPDEVEQVVNTRPRLLLTGREGTEYVFGTTSAGRYLLIVLRRRWMGGTTWLPPAR